MCERSNMIQTAWSANTLLIDFSLFLTNENDGVDRSFIIIPSWSSSFRGTYLFFIILLLLFNVTTKFVCRKLLYKQTVAWKGNNSCLKVHFQELYTFNFIFYDNFHFFVQFQLSFVCFLKVSAGNIWCVLWNHKFVKNISATY